MDEVMWAFDAWTLDAGNKPILKPLLKLTGPTTAHVNQTITLTVADGVTGCRVLGANLNITAPRSDGMGHILVSFDTTGVKYVKAENAGSIRSNRLKITVEK